MEERCFIMVFIVWICIQCLFQSNFAGESTENECAPPIVTLKLGNIRGSYITSRLGNDFMAFRGIRYAQPPVNELRFKVNNFITNFI